MKPQLIYGSSLFAAIEKGLLPGLEYNGTNYLYNLEPKANNLFYVGNLSVTGKATETDNYSLPNTRFRVNKISFPFMKLQFDAPSRGIPTPLLKSVSLGNTCSITWVEDVYKTVERYHHFWMRNWYRREDDSLPVGINGKFKRLEIYPFRYKATYQENTPYVTNVTTQVLYKIIIDGLAPVDLKNIEYDMNEPGTPLATYEYSIHYATLQSNRLSEEDAKAISESNGIDSETNIRASETNGIFNTGSLYV